MENVEEYLKQTQKWVKKELDLCNDFWLKNGKDDVNGGVYTCLDREGKIYSTDKSVWMQGRCGWTYAHLYNTFRKNEKWLEFSASCLDFMENHCINKSAGRRMYFTVTGDGKPLRQRRYCFSEGFYCIANAEYYMATGKRECLERASEAYKLIYDLNHGMKDPTGLGSKTEEATRKCRALADPMIFLNITAVMRKADKENIELYDKYANESVETILKYHHKPELGCTLETVGINGEFLSDVTAGRVVNPGHDIECSWFLMEQANYKKDKKLYEKALEIYRLAYEGGYDKQYGGLLYFRDCLGNPPEAYEHDMKLWWPHNEALIASLMAYRDTKEVYYLENFKTIVDYCKEHFCDDAYGEWFGYLRRDGKPTEPPCKGSTFKGPFHVQRSLMKINELIDEICNA